MEKNSKSLLDRVIDKLSIFGHRRTTINQIHFMYWALGEFYQSSTLNKKITSGLILLYVSNFLTILSFSSSYVFLSSIREYSKIMFIIEMIAIAIFCTILLPTITCVNYKHTFESFKILDQELHDFKHISSSQSSRSKFAAEDRKYIRDVILTQFFLGLLSFVLVYFDLIYNYSREKLRTVDHYLYPVYCEWVFSLKIFLVLSFFQMMSVIPIAMVMFLLPTLCLTLVRECRLQFQVLCDSLDHQSKLFSKRFENILMGEETGTDTRTSNFQNVLIQNAHRAADLHQKLVGGINHLKSFLEQAMSASAVMFLVVEVVFIFLSIHVDEKSLVQKLRLVCYALSFLAIVFVNCLVGKLFTDMGEKFNDIVYDLPWYYLSPSRRKSVYLLLHQAQIPIEFKALKIFPKSMGFFLKLCRFVYSFVNVLRFTFAVRDT